MNREIKFRAWAYPNKKMYYNIQVGGFPDTAVTGTVPSVFNKEKGEWVNLWGSNLHDGIIMQYTGLKDEKGKDIYEGDIVEHCDRFGDEKTIQRFTVSWASNGRFFYESHEDFEYDSLLGVTPVKVIGNIFENPDLLPTL